MDRQLRHYVDATLPDSPPILGVPLQPFSIGKFILMEHYGCSFTFKEWNKEAAERMMIQLRIALAICSRGFTEFQEFLHNKPQIHTVLDAPHVVWNYFLNFVTGTTYPERWFKKWNRQLIKQLRQNRLLRLLGIKQKKYETFNVLEQVALFKKYKNAGIRTPHYWNESDKESTSGASWVQTIYVFLLSRMSKEDALNYPLAQAVADWCKHLEDNGAVTFKQEWQIALEEGAQDEQG